MSIKPTRYKKILEDVIDTGDDKLHRIITLRRTLAALVKLVLALAVAFGFFYFVTISYKHTIPIKEPPPEYYGDEPFPVVVMTDAQMAALQDRFTAFVDQLISIDDDNDNTNTNAESFLVVTQDEINACLDYCQSLRGMAMVTLNDTSIIVEEYSLYEFMTPSIYMTNWSSLSLADRLALGRDRYGELNYSTSTMGRVNFQVETTTDDPLLLDLDLDGPLLFAQLQLLVNNYRDVNELLGLCWDMGSFFGPSTVLQEVLPTGDDSHNSTPKSQTVVLLERNCQNLYNYCLDGGRPSGKQICDDAYDDCKESKLPAILNGIGGARIENSSIRVTMRATK